MRSFTIATIALASAVSAQTAGYHAINLPGMNEEVPACSTYEIVWTPSTQYSGMVTFQLIGGSTQETLVPIGDMFGSADGAAGKYEWSVPCDEGDDAIYGLKIHQVEDPSVFQYSMPFQISPSEDGDDTTSTPTETPTETPDKTYPSTKPTGHYSHHNSTVTSPTTFTTTTAPSNSTTSSQKPTSLTTSTAVITADTDSEPTTSPETETPGSSASRAFSSSFAVLAVAAAFLAL